MNNVGHAIHLKKEILVRLIKAYLSDNFEEKTRLIPYDMRPKGMEVPYRCCVYKERAIIKDRTIAGLGFQIEEDDETVSLATYAKKAQERRELDGKNSGNLFPEDSGLGNDDDLYNQAVQIVQTDKKVSISYVQRRLKIGYNRAATIVEKMEENGIITPPDHSGKREVL